MAIPPIPKKGRISCHIIMNKINPSELTYTIVHGNNAPKNIIAVGPGLELVSGREHVEFFIDDPINAKNRWTELGGSLDDFPKITFYVIQAGQLTQEQINYFVKQSSFYTNNPSWKYNNDQSLALLVQKGEVPEDIHDTLMNVVAGGPLNENNEEVFGPMTHEEKIDYMQRHSSEWS